MKRLIIITLLTLCTKLTFAAEPELKFKIPNGDSNAYFKLNMLNQVWMRYAELNPNTLVENAPQKQVFDIGLRRTRWQLFSQLNKRTLLYFQFGMNNFNFTAANSGNRKLQPFFHDALVQYQFLTGKNYLEVGTGLTVYNGLSRFSSPGVSSIMTLDVPVFAQTTVDQTDEFSRKLGIYTHGQAGKLNYRLVLSNPFPIYTNGNTIPPISQNASFATKTKDYLQYQGFFQWNFFDKEYSQAPGYNTGTYLGKRKIFNLEAGIISQPNAMYKLAENKKDTVYQSMLHYSVAAYLDIPLNKIKGTAISAYLGYFKLNYGSNYKRFNGIMNSGTSSNGSPQFGNNYLMFGTGQVLYSQIGYKFKDSLLGPNLGTIMPYASIQLGKYEGISVMLPTYNVGINLLMNGHRNKLTLGWENRPLLSSDLKTVQDRKNTILLQWQMFI